MQCARRRPNSVWGKDGKKIEEPDGNVEGDKRKASVAYEKYAKQTSKRQRKSELISPEKINQLIDLTIKKERLSKKEYDEDWLQKKLASLASLLAKGVINEEEFKLSRASALSKYTVS